ncbi:MAG: DUF1638 domain-containing protein [Oscillospiraceae bacterium]|nr:DUF1638 domain-containing protein [Oscillospiraceae bacterium]
METSKKYLVIACDILFREVCLCASQSKNIIDIIFQKKALHDTGEAFMSKTLQNTIDNADCEDYDAVLLCYGLCNNGIVNLRAPVPLVVPRAHDCITLLLGSKEKYADYFFADNGGTYYYSSGWLERNTGSKDTEEQNISNQLGLNKSYESYVEEYGEENAEYIMSILGSWAANYSKAAFIDNKIGDIQNNRKKTMEIAESRGWEYEEIEGSNILIEKLLEGEWDSADFLVILPDHKIEPSHDGGIVKSAAL